jgi:hypothetical protein
MTDIAPAERLHHARQAQGRLRRRQQMHVVGHQHIGMDGAAMARRRLGEPRAIELVVLVAKEHGLAVVAALDQMQGLIGQEISAEPSHGAPLRSCWLQHIRRPRNSTLTPIPLTCGR